MNGFIKTQAVGQIRGVDLAGARRRRQEEAAEKALQQRSSMC